MKKLFVLCIIVFLFGACRYTDGKDLKKEAQFQPFEPPIPYETAMAKADSILQQMSLEEKIAMIGGHNVFFTKGYDKYGIPSLRFSDATQGVRLIDDKSHLEKSVAFPCPIALTSTWNTDLARAYAKSIGEECRAGNIAVLLGPGMNIYRISQNGRNFEYFGEDPYLAARMVENYVVGLQNTGTIATLKHFIANNSDFRRRTSNSVVSERALHEIYMPAFEAGINAGALAVMTAYNQVNGEYCAQSKYVISKLLREDLGFKWLVMSDWLSIWDAEKALKSGLDLDMPGETEDGIYSEDEPAEYLRREAPRLIEEGKVKEEDVDRMVKNILGTIIAMGLTERGVKDTSYLQNYDKHIEVALETAREGIVLLKNDNQILPFRPKKGDIILVTGEYVDVLASGGGSAAVDGFDVITIFVALKAQFGENVKHIEHPTDEEIANASIVIYNVATKDSEGSDISFDLLEEINTTISRIAKLNEKTVVVMNAGGGRNMTSWNNEVAAILYNWYPGQVGNQALAEIIAGVTNPSGKLPITIERDFKDSPGYPYLPEGEELYTGWDFDMDMDFPVFDINYNEGVFVGYRWYEHKNIQPLYAFGHGLSYSTFEYSNLKTNAENYTMDDDVLVKVEVANTGEVDGKEIVQLYVKDLEATVERPVKELKDFQKVHLKAGEKKTVYFTLNKRDFAFWDEKTSSWKVEPGEFEIQIAASSADIKLVERISLNSTQTPVNNASYEPTWESLARHETPEWYENAVLGIYFHWGVYSVPAFGCWGGRNMYQPNGGRSEEWGHIEDKYTNTYDYVKQVYGEPGKDFGYKDFIPMFKAEKWNPDRWAELFKKAGADFAGPVAIHHDGFAMWDSDYAEYNSMDMGPHRDVVGEMLEAVRKHDMNTFASFHQHTNWFFFNPGRKLCPKGVDVNNEKYAGLYGPVREYKGMWREVPFSERFQQAWYNEVIEVIDKYHPDQLWFEHGFSHLGNIGENYVKSVLAHYFNTAEKLDKEVVVTRKSDDLPLSCSVLDLEAHELDEAQPDVWQTDIALGTNHAWAYSPDAVCRPINDIVDEIVDRKSKNGVTLLSVAPKADGTLPPSQVEGLKKLGDWMTINKPALYASKPAPFVEGGVDVAEAGSMRFTMKGNFLYAIDLAEPKAPHVIPGVKPVKDSKIIMLGSIENLPWHQEGEDVVIEKIPDPLPCDYAWTFKIQYKE